MKILYVCKALPNTYKGGIQTHIWKLSAAMHSLGHNVTILTAGSIRRQSRSYEMEGRIIQEIPYVPGRKSPIFPKLLEDIFFNISAKKWLKKHGHDYDIIHLQGRSGSLFPCKKQENYPPCVATFHALTKTELKISQQQKKVSLDDLLHSRFSHAFERKTFLNATKTIAVSQEMKSDLQNYFGNQKSVSVIYNGAPKPGKANLKTSKNLLFVGRLEAIKGVNLLPEIVNQLEQDVHMTVIGDGSMKKNIQKEVKSMSLQDRFTFLGSQDEEEIRAWLSKSFALLLPSHYETQGIVLMEANSMGTPVIATDIPGVNEVIRHGKNGYLFHRNDIDQVVYYINQLLNRPSQGQKMGLWGQNWMQANFSWEKIARNTESIYHQALAK